jgi:hypothetical protein
MIVRGFGEKTQSDYIRHVKTSQTRSAARQIKRSPKSTREVY